MMKIILLLILSFESLAGEGVISIKNTQINADIVENPQIILDQPVVTNCGEDSSGPGKHCTTSSNSNHDTEVDTMEDKGDAEEERVKLQDDTVNVDSITEKFIEISAGDIENNGIDGEKTKQSSDDNSKAEANSTVKVVISKQVVCNQTQVQNITNVEIINATQILKLLQVDVNITGKAAAANCHLVYFFNPYCAFSVRGSAYVNALARSIKNIPVFGLDSIEHHNLNSRYGVAGTPSLVLFHNGLIVGRYNASEFTTSNLMAFVHHYTDQNIEDVNVTSSDFKAELPSQVIYTTPYVIYFCWIFLICDIIWFFMRSRLYAKITEIFVNNWREAEAQHEHED